MKKSTKKRFFNKEQVKILNEEAAKIQPDVVKKDSLESCDDEDKEIYDLMQKFYKKLCKLDVCFQLNFLLPKSEMPEMFYRICDLNNQERYQRFANKLFYNSYNFLCWAGVIKHLEERGELKILPKGEHQTFAEKVDFDSKK